MTPPLRAKVPGLSCLLLVCATGCSRSTDPQSSLVKSAQFGLFFGGQIQQRLEIPSVLDSTQSGRGLRLEFRRPLPGPTRVTWHLDHPTARTGPRGPGNAPRAVRTESVTLPAGTDRFERLLALRPTDPPGTYDILVMVDDEVVLDRSFRLVQHRLDSDE